MEVGDELNNGLLVVRFYVFKISKTQKTWKLCSLTFPSVPSHPPGPKTVIFTSNKKINSAQVDALREKLMKDVQNLENVLDKEKSKQEQALHEKLSARKLKRLQEMVSKKMYIKLPCVLQIN